MKSSKLFVFLNLLSFVAMITILATDGSSGIWEKLILILFALLFIVSGFKSVFANNIWFRSDKERISFTYKEYSYLASALLIISIAGDLLNDANVFPKDFNMLHWMSYVSVYLALFLHRIMQLFDKEKEAKA